MPNSISCPHCERLLLPPENYQGGELRCPECDKVFGGGGQTDITAQPLRPTGATASPDLQPGLPPVRGDFLRGIDGFDEATGIDSDLRERLALLREFKKGGALVLAVKTLLALNLLLSLAMLASNYLQYDLAERLLARANVPEAEIKSNDDRKQVIALAYLGIYIVTAVVFAVWFYRIHANLKPLGASGLTYTSGWAAGAWFVPILNLFRPFQIAQEIWRNSDPNAGVGIYRHAEAPPNSALIGWWWATWIVASIISQVATRMTLAVRSPEGLKAASLAEMMGDVAVIIAAAFCLAVVNAIDGRQAARADALRAELETPAEDES